MKLFSSKVFLSILCFLFILTSISYVFPYIVNASGIIQIGLPCEINSGSSYTYINANRSHSHYPSQQGYSFDLQENDECANDKVVAPISGNISTYTSDDTQYCIDGNGNYIVSPAINSYIVITRADGVEVQLLHHDPYSYTSTVGDGYVEAGEILATISDQGCAVGEHIHINVLQNGNFQPYSNWEFVDIDINEQADDDFVGDFNGDGKDDFLNIYKDEEKFFVRESTGDKLLGAKKWIDGPYDYSYLDFRVGDVNGDSKDDVIGINPSDERFIVWTANSTGTGFNGGVNFLNGPYDYSYLNFDVGDVNGDGKDDIVGIDPSDERFIVWTANSTGTGFNGGVNWYNGPYNYSYLTFTIGDVNGDGKDDIIGIDHDDERFIVWPANSGGTAFSGGINWYNGPYSYGYLEFNVADVNNDGKEDIVGIDPNDERLITWTTNSGGTAFSGGANWYNGPYSYPTHTFAVGDIDGDGNNDVVAAKFDNENYITWKSTGSLFAGGNQLYNGTSDYTNYQFLTGDIDNDGEDDVIGIDSSSERFILWESGSESLKGSRVLYDGSNSYTNYKFEIGDINNDGRDDIIAINPTDERFVIWKMKTTELSLNGGVEGYNGPYNYSNLTFTSSDVNGDGKADIVGIIPSDERFIVWTANSAGTGFNGGANWYNGPYNYNYLDFYVEDVSGDGKADIVGINPADERFVVWTANSTGTGFNGGANWLNGPYNYSYMEFRIDDVNADGKSDIIGIDSSDERFVVWTSKTSTVGFNSGANWKNGNLNYSGYNITTGDVDGDGKADMVGSNGQDERFVVWQGSPLNFTGGNEWLKGI